MNPELFQATRNSILNIDHLLNDLLSWSRSQFGHLSPEPVSFDLSEPIQNMVLLHRPLAEQKQITIDLELQTPLMCYADPAMITTVVRNLLSNAVKFTPKQGTIKLQASFDDSHVLVEIQDSGTGMAPGLRKQLFKPSSKVTSQLGTEKEKGTGLGLMLCQEFIDKNEGVIGAESTVGQGSRFWFSLPQQSR